MVTVFDVCLSQLAGSDESVRCESRNWLKNKALDLICAVCLSSLRSESTERIERNCDEIEKMKIRNKRRKYWIYMNMGNRHSFITNNR